MGSLIFHFLERLARATGIPVQAWFTIIAGFGVFVAQEAVGMTWALAIWIPIWAIVMYMYKGESGD